MTEAKLATNSLEGIFNNLKSQFGVGSVRCVGQDNGVLTKVAFQPTPSYRLNQALGIGGLPYGRLTEIYGPESGGKTTLVLCTIALAQKSGNIAAIIDAEHAHDDVYASSCGVDVSKLIVLQPDNGEEAVDMVRACLLQGINIVAVDSLAALVPKVELEGDITDANMGLHAKLVGRLCRISTPLIKQDQMLILINQLRLKIGVFFGSPETTPGGNAPKFFSSVRLDVRISERKETYNDVKIKIVKNKCGSPYKEVFTRIVFGFGIDGVYELVDQLVEHEIIEFKNGGHYSLKGEKLCQGKDKLIEMLRADNELLGTLEKALTELLK